VIFKIKKYICWLVNSILYWALSFVSFTQSFASYFLYDPLQKLLVAIVVSANIFHH